MVLRSDARSVEPASASWRRRCTRWQVSLRPGLEGGTSVELSGRPLRECKVASHGLTCYPTLMAPSTTVEVRGWLDPPDDAWVELCLLHALERVIGCDDMYARRLAQQFREQGSVIVDTPSRETAERLSEDLQGAGALIYLAPSDVPVILTEVHSATWGALQDDTASCQRRTPSRFHVRFWAPTTNGVTGEPAPRPTSVDGFSLAGVAARRVAVMDEDADSALLDIELVKPLRSVAFVPDPALCHPGGVALETAMRLVGGRVIVNWISEDHDYWYFFFFCFGPNCTRVSKQDGVCTRIRRARSG